MTDTRGEMLESRKGTVGEDPMVGESRAEGKNLHETMENVDTFKEDIQKGYNEDTFFRKVLEDGEGNPMFRIHKGMVWTQNRGERR